MAYRRSIFLINPKFQLRFAIYVCLWLVGLSFVYPMIVNQLFDYFLRYAALDPNGPPLDRLQAVKEQVVWLLVALQLVFMFVTFLISIFMSHRIAGPLHKLKLFFAAASQGKIGEPLLFRKKDHFQDVADEYNIMMRGIKSILDQNSEALDKIALSLEEASLSVPIEARARIEEAVSRLREVRKKFPN